MGGPLALLLGTLLAIPAASQDEASLPASTTHQWGAITRFHGLPSDTVRSIAQDRDGVVWFGTDAGLARSDGLRLQKVVADSLPAGPVRALALDEAGGLWIATLGGAALRRGDAFVAVPGTTGQAIAAILAVPGRPVVLASEEGRLFTCTVHDEAPPEVVSLGPEQERLLTGGSGRPLPLASLALHEGEVLVGTLGRGVLELSAGRLRERVTAGNRPFFVAALASLGDHLLLGAETSASGPGLFEASGGATRALPLGTGSVSALATDARGELWVATRERGVFRVRENRVVEQLTFESTGGGLRSNHVYSVQVDAEGVVWFGTDRGACRFDPGSPRPERISPQPESNFVHALLRTADGRLWAGTQRGLLVREGGVWRRVEELTRRIVHALAVDAEGRLVVGSASGLHRGTAGAGGWRFEALPAGASVRAIRLFQGALHLATFGGGLERLDGEVRRPIWPAGAEPGGPRELVSLEVAGDRLLVGSAAGEVFAFDGQRAAPLPGLARLSGATVWSLARAGDGALWLATSRGLFRQRQALLETVLDGQEVRAVVPDHDRPGAAWCATASGAWRVALDGPAALVARLDSEHGLPSDSVYAVAPDGQGLVFGTNRGVASYTPDRIAPRLRVTRVLGRRPYLPEEWQAGLQLDYPQDSLLLEVAAAASRTFPEEFQHAFELQDAGGRVLRRKLSREAQLVAESLAPGRYRVVARAFSRDLVASQPVDLAFEVARAPFPWVTVALGTLLGAALLALGWGLHQNRQLSGANRALAETRRELAGQTENERRRIARDLHDQTLFDLRRLLLAPEGPPDFRGSVEAISREVRRICEDLSPSVLENVGLTAALEWSLTDSVAHLPAEATCAARFVCPDGLEDRLTLDAAARIQIYRIVHEAVANACRHSGARHLVLAVDLEGDAFTATLEDDGCGFDPAAVPAKGRGLASIRSRASLMEAEVSWEPRPGGGTRFRLRKPRAA